MSSRRLWLLAMTMVGTALVFNLSACGLKGKLKSPSQIAHDEAKKEKKQADEENAESLPSPASPASPEPPSSPASPASPAGGQ